MIPYIPVSSIIVILNLKCYPARGAGSMKANIILRNAMCFLCFVAHVMEKPWYMLGPKMAATITTTVKSTSANE